MIFNSFLLPDVSQFDNKENSGFASFYLPKQLIYHISKLPLIKKNCNTIFVKR